MFFLQPAKITLLALENRVKRREKFAQATKTTQLAAFSKFLFPTRFGSMACINRSVSRRIFQ
jgi:hypothetical protein